MVLSPSELKDFLDYKASQYNQPDFIEEDPIAIPHLFTHIPDQEVAGFLTATIAWGKRKSIILNANKLMQQMGNSPFDFVMQASHSQIMNLNFVHRTFNKEDLRVFVYALRRIYSLYGGMLPVFVQNAQPHSLQMAISEFRKEFFSLNPESRSLKHISDPLKGSAAKRINMMLRWFVRKDNKGVDLGIWNHALSPAQLSIPLDIHSGNMARKLGLLFRKSNDAKAVHELDVRLRSFNPSDPVLYDFALFGLGVNHELF